MPIDWSKITAPVTPVTPQIDWGKITSAPQPMMEWTSRSSLPKRTTDIPLTPQIDWTRIKPIEPIRPITSLNFSDTIPDDELEIPGADIQGAETPEYNPQLGIPDIQLQPGQYMPKVDLGQGSQMPRGFYAEANARKEDIQLTPGAPPLRQPTIEDYGKAAVDYTKNLAGKVWGEKGKPLVDLPQVMRQEVGKPIAEKTPIVLNRAAILPTWHALNEPLSPELEKIPGDIAKDIPGFGPYAEKITDFIAEGTTSPLGLVTLGGARALQVGLKSGGFIAKNLKKLDKVTPPPSIIGPLTKEEALSPATLGFKLLSHIEEAKLTRAAQEKMYTQTLRQRVANRAKVTLEGFEGLLARKKTLSGPLPKEQFTPIAIHFNEAEHKAMIDLIEKSPLLKQLDKASAQDGLEKLMGFEIAGVPEMSELKLLETVFPGISKIKTPGIGIIHGVGEFGGAARALESSFDLSFPGRQGAWLASRPQYWKSWKPMFEGIDDAGYATHMDNIVKRKHYALGQREGLEVTDARNIFNAEDEFSSMIARMPGVRHSSQGFSAFANELRQSMFDDMVDAAIANGKNPYKNEKVARELTKYINAATGRGGLSDFFKQHQYTLNQILFSPRLVSSRLNLLKRATYDVAKTGYNVAVGGVDLKRVKNLPFADTFPAVKALGGKLESAAAGINVKPKTLFPGKGYEVVLPGIKKGKVFGLKHTKFGGEKLGKPVAKGGIGLKEYAQVDPFIRRQFWRDFMGYVGTQTIIMAPFKAAQMMGSNVKFSADPTNPDFGKARIGDIRFDSNGGFQPYLRAAAQIMQQKKTSSVSGKVTRLGEGYKPDTDFDVLEKLIMSKASPLASLGLNILRGETLTGEAATLTSELQSKLTPIFAQDIVEVLKEDPRMIPILIPTFFGTGLQVYGPGDIKKQARKSPYAVTMPKPKRFKLKF